MLYDEDTQFKENNITLYLSELEEYISLLITYMAYKKTDPSAPISTLNLEKMAQKEFDKGPQNVTFMINFRLNLQLPSTSSKKERKVKTSSPTPRTCIRRSKT